MDPNLRKVLDKYEGKVNLIKVNVDDLQDLALEYGVSSQNIISFHSYIIIQVLDIDFVSLNLISSYCFALSASIEILFRKSIFKFIICKTS